MQWLSCEHEEQRRARRLRTSFEDVAHTLCRRTLGSVCRNAWRYFAEILRTISNIRKCCLLRTLTLYPSTRLTVVGFNSVSYLSFEFHGTKMNEPS